MSNTHQPDDQESVHDGSHHGFVQPVLVHHVCYSVLAINVQNVRDRWSFALLLQLFQRSCFGLTEQLVRVSTSCPGN